MSVKHFCIYIFFLAGCADKTISNTPLIEKHNLVYHIKHDEKLDDKNFTLCNAETAYSYYGFNNKPYEDKDELKKYFIGHYTAYENESHNTGFITIRFIINCRGEAGRFRTIAFTPDYQPASFDNNITQQLLQLTQNYSKWKWGIYQNQFYDSYFYLCFKIEKGKLIDITP